MVMRPIQYMRIKKVFCFLGCWAHARRKFNEALKEDKSGAQYALEQIGMIYEVESMADDQELDHQQRAELRQDWHIQYCVLLRDGS